MLGVDKREWPTFIKTPRADATTSYVHNRDGDLCAIVCLREREGITPIAIAALLVHEAVHIWQAHTAQFGGDDAGEFEAYNIQTISQRLMYEYTRRNANH